MSPNINNSMIILSLYINRHHKYVQIVEVKLHGFITSDLDGSGGYLHISATLPPG
jgi:hypothetical protein